MFKFTRKMKIHGHAESFATNAKGKAKGLEDAKVTIKLTSDEEPDWISHYERELQNELSSRGKNVK